MFSFKTHNFNYLVNTIFDRNIISNKMISDYFLNYNSFLTLANNKEYKVYCDYQKKISIKTDKNGFINFNERWDNKNEILLLQTNGDLNEWGMNQQVPSSLPPIG